MSLFASLEEVTGAPNACESVHPGPKVQASSNSAVLSSLRASLLLVLSVGAKCSQGFGSQGSEGLGWARDCRAPKGLGRHLPALHQAQRRDHLPCESLFRSKP